jgi:hypothetical protein
MFDDETRQTLASLASNALPYVLLGALGGATVSILDGLRSKSRHKREDHFASHPYVNADPYLVEQLIAIKTFSSINPSWFDVFIDHVNLVCFSWYRVNDMMKEARRLVPQYVDDANQAMQSPLKFIAQFVGGRDDVRHADPRHATVVVGELNKLMLDMNELLEACLKTKTTLAGLVSEFLNTVGLFNRYWDQVKSLVMQESGLYYEAYAQQIEQEKLESVISIVETGRLLIPVDGLPEDATTASFLKWWISMHTMYCPSMRSVASHMGWYSAVNPNSSEDGRTGESQDQRRSTGVILPGAGNGNSQREAGHSFMQKGSNVKKSVALKKRSGESERHMEQWVQFQKSPQAQVTRPSVNDSLANQIKFLANRVRMEGLASVIKSPWAGYTTSVEDECFIPTVRVDEDVLVDRCKKVQAKMDAKMEDMFAAQYKLVRMASSISESQHVEDEFNNGATEALHLQQHWADMQY